MVRRLDATAHDEVRWARTFRLQPGTLLSACELLPDNNLVLALATANPTTSILALKLNSGTGIVEWQRRIVDAALSAANSLTVLPDGLLVFGVTTAAPVNRAFVQKIDLNGNYVAGWTVSNGDFIGVDAWSNPITGRTALLGYLVQPGGSNAALVQLDAGGTVLSARRFSTIATTPLVMSVAPGPNFNGSYILAHTAAFSLHPHLFHVDSAGTVQWSFGVTQADELVNQNLVRLRNGDALVSSGGLLSQNDPAHLTRITPTGAVRWSNAYAIPRSGLFDMREAPNGDLLSVGFQYVPTGGAVLRADLLALRVDSAGQLPCCPLVSSIPLDRENVPLTSSAYTLATTPFERLTTITLPTTTRTWIRFDTCTAIVPDSNAIVSDTLICTGDLITPQVVAAQAGYSYAWTFTGGSPATGAGANPGPVRYDKPGEYVVEVQAIKDSCPLPPVTVTILVGGDHEAPSAFTPNGDGHNNTFRPLVFCPVADYRLEIYSRWGQRVFTTNDQQEGWDGQVDGHPSPADTYVWKLEYSIGLEGGPKKMMAAGDVTLLR